MAHLCNANGKHDGDDGGKTLGDGRHGKRYRHHERVEHQADVTKEGKAAVLDHANQNDDRRYPHNKECQDTRKLSELNLQRRLFVLGLGQRVRNLAHLGIHAGAHDHGPAATVHDDRAHVAHVLAVSQRDVVLSLSNGQCVGTLLYGDGLAREGSLLHLHTGGFQDAAVCRHGVARLEHHDITWHQLGRRHRDYAPIAHDLALCGSHFLQRLKRLFGFALLDDAEHRIEDDNEQDDAHVGKALAASLVDAHGSRYHGRNEQHDDHRVGHLGKESLPQRSLLALVELVWAMLIQTRGCLVCRQTTLRICALFFQHRSRFQKIRLHALLPS